MYRNVLILLSVFVIGAYSKKLPLPSYLKPCHRKSPDFSECVVRNGRDAIPTLVKGDRKYGIPVLAPMVIPSVEMSTSEQLKLTLTDLHIYNFDKTEIRKGMVDLENRKISLELYFDPLNIQGKYDINGKLLILPIQGKGDVNVTAVAMTVQYAFGYTLETKDGVEYISVVEPTADFTVKRAYFHLTNLFNGNEQLGESTNKVLNDEWEKFVEEIKPPICQLIVQIANGIVNSITSKVPYNEFFPE